MTKDAPPISIRLRTKIGAHEFEAEGPGELVAAHFKTWQQLILTPLPGEPSARPLAPQTPVPPAVAAEGQSAQAGGGPLDLFTVTAASKRVALRLYPGGKTQHADAALLLLHGCRLAFGDDGQTMLVTRLKAALAASGYRDARVDRILAPHLAARLVRKTGRRIGSTYALTPAGLQRAEALTSALLASTPSVTNTPRPVPPSP